MDPNALNERLAKLHAELLNVHEEHPATRAALGSVLLDIERLRGAPADPVATQEPASLSGRLERLAVQFEADHPKLAANARSLIDLLGEAGV